MKTIPNRTIYRCDFCTTHRLSAKAAQHHERYCRSNPANKHACFGCEFLVVDRQVVGVAEDGNPLVERYQSFTCAKRQLSMYSYVAERRGLVEKLGPEVVRMPLQCSDYEPEQFDSIQNPLPPSVF